MAKREYSNKEIIKIIQGMFPRAKIMFAYYCGSIAYGTEGENSDIDVTVVMSGLTGNIHMDAGNLDLFIYGEDCYLDKQYLSDKIPLYNKIYIDDVLEIDKNLIYLNPDYTNEFNSYKNINLEIKLKPYLSSFIEYYSNVINDRQEPVKRLYHVFRMRGIIDHFDKTGKYELVVEEPWKARMLKYKKDWDTEIGKVYFPMIKEQMNYLKNYKDRLC